MMRTKEEIDIKQVWEKANANIKNNTLEHKYNLWLSQIKIDEINSNFDTLVLLCPNIFTKKKIMDEYSDLIKSEYSKITKQKCSLTINIQAEEFAIQSKELKAEIIRLPVWPEDKRGAPASILRSALFSVVKRGRRRHIDDELVASWKGVEIRYKGDLLDQADLDVWLEATNRCRPEPLGYKIYFSAYNFLKAINRATGKMNHVWLKKTFLRLKANAVQIKIGHIMYCGSLIDEYYHDDETEKYVIILNPKIAGLFQDDYVRLNWNTRKQLQGDIEKWVHAYVCSQKATLQAPHKISLMRLKELCGSQENEIKHFRYEIRQTMEKLVTLEVVQFWNITLNDVLEFVRNNTSDQKVIIEKNDGIAPTI